MFWVHRMLPSSSEIPEVLSVMGFWSLRYSERAAFRMWGIDSWAVGGGKGCVQGNRVNVAAGDVEFGETDRGPVMKPAFRPGRLAPEFSRRVPGPERGSSRRIAGVAGRPDRDCSSGLWPGSRGLDRLPFVATSS